MSAPAQTRHAAGRAHVVATDISAQPALARDDGFRLLVLRQFPRLPAPPAFAVIDQCLVRSPLRPNRHGMAFAIAFLPEIVDWLILELGRPSLRAPQGTPHRNPRWPRLDWWHEARAWPDGTETIEWCVEAMFPEPASWRAFEARWRARLEGVCGKDATPAA